MDQKSQALTQNEQKAVSQQPASLAISERGVRTGGDFALLMSALMSDILGGRVSPQVGNAACNAGGKLLKIVEMQYQYGHQTTPGGGKELSLVPKQESVAA